ncbi:MAG: butyrate kinase [Clostridium sp.]
MAKKSYILVINPGSTSTKLAIFNGENCIVSNNLSHDVEEIKSFDCIYDQKDMRIKVILQWLSEKGIELNELKAVVGRGGLLRPMPGGTYEVTDKMIEDLKIGIQGQHASNLGGIIAKEIAKKTNVSAYIVDPVAVDEICDEARISGIPELPRRSLLHALNMKAVARRVCKEHNMDFKNSNFVIAHIGGGISVSPFSKGKLLDCNNASEEGPFSPERSGGLPVGDIIEMAFSGKYTEKELSRKIMGQGGMVAYLDTNDGRVVGKSIEQGDKKAELILKAMAYQIAKEIGAMATVIEGKVDKIIVTGGLANDKRLVQWIENHVSFIAPIALVPGEDEMLALAEGALRVINGQEESKIYEKEIK